MSPLTKPIFRLIRGSDSFTWIINLTPAVKGKESYDWQSHQNHM